LSRAARFFTPGKRFCRPGSCVTSTRLGAMPQRLTAGSGRGMAVSLHRAAESTRDRGSAQWLAEVSL
jgi:hypothetical protein